MSNGSEVDTVLEFNQPNVDPRPVDDVVSQVSKGTYGMPELDVESFRVKDDSIEDREGNFIITVGNVGSGKSTLQHHLVVRLNDHPNIALEWNNRDNDPKHDFFLERWLDYFKQTQMLPARTKAGLLQEFNLKVTQRKKKPLEFNFLEISGENIKIIRPELLVGARADDGSEELDTEFTQGHLPENIGGYLKNDACKKRFIFVSDCSVNGKHKKYKPSGQPREDSLFLALLKHLLENEDIRLRRLEILFVAAKWDLVDKGYKNNEEYYFEDNFENTMSYLREKAVTKNIKYHFTPYSIGDVVIDDDPKYERPMARIKGRVETHYIDIVAHWALQSFSGVKWEGLPPITLTFWEKIKRLFA